METPEWLLKDIRELALESTRISCAIYELYNKYAFLKNPHEDVDKHQEFNDLINERLDFIDGNIEMIRKLIMNEVR